jgi:AraC-like DNA-binding protein
MGDYLRALRAQSDLNERNHLIPCACPRPPVNSAAVQQLLGDYQAGISANQLATRYQLSRSSVRRLLRESGTPRRYQAMTEDEVVRAVELYQSGLTIA